MHAIHSYSREALALAQAAEARGCAKVLGGHYRKLCDLVRGSLPTLTGDCLLATDIAVAMALLQTEVAQIHCLAQEHDHEAD